MAMNPGAGPRRAERRRSTKETEVAVIVELDGTGAAMVASGLPFFDHMLAQLGRHGGLNLDVKASGDLDVDAHHTVEDTGIVVGEALAEALGSKIGIRRFASISVPLDEALVDVALDLSGRPYLHYDVATRRRRAARQSSLRRPAGRGVLARVRALGGDHAAHRASIRAQPASCARGVLQRSRAGIARRRADRRQ